MVSLATRVTSLKNIVIANRTVVKSDKKDQLVVVLLVMLDNTKVPINSRLLHVQIATQVDILLLVQVPVVIVLQEHIKALTDKQVGKIKSWGRGKKKNVDSSKAKRLTKCLLYMFIYMYTKKVIRVVFISNLSFLFSVLLSSLKQQTNKYLKLTFYLSHILCNFDVLTSLRESFHSP